MVSSATWTVTMRRAWMRPRAIFCPATMITPVLLATALHGDRLGRWPGRRPGRAGAAQPAGLVPGQRVGPGAQQLAGFGVEEHQRGLLDADRDAAAAEDLRGQDVAVRPGGPRRPWTRSGRPRSRRRARRAAAEAARPGRPPVAARAIRSASDRWERRVLILAPPIRQVDDVGAGPERDHHPGPGGPSQNCRPATFMFPLAGTTRSNSTGPPRYGGADAGGAGCQQQPAAACGAAGLARTPRPGRSRRQPQGQQVPLGLRRRVLNRSAGGPALAVA